MLGADGVAEVGDVGLGLVFGGVADVRLDVEQFAHRLHDGLVEVHEELPFLLEERRQVVGIELEERRLAVGAAYGVPVEVLPVAVVAHPHVASERGVSPVLHRHGERQGAVRGGDDTPVAVGLLDEAVVSLHPHQRVPVQFLIPLHRSEIGR